MGEAFLAGDAASSFDRKLLERGERENPRHKEKKCFVIMSHPFLTFQKNVLAPMTENIFDILFRNLIIYTLFLTLKMTSNFDFPLRLSPIQLIWKLNETRFCYYLILMTVTFMMNLANGEHSMFVIYVMFSFIIFRG